MVHVPSRFGSRLPVVSAIAESCASAGRRSASELGAETQASHRFLRAPLLLDSTFQLKTTPGIYFAGQISGVEGYVQSAASGLLVAPFIAERLAALQGYEYAGDYDECGTYMAPV